MSDRSSRAGEVHDGVEPVDIDGGDVEPEPGSDWTPVRLRKLRRDPGKRRVALVVAAAVGLAAAWLHWLGLVVAGGLVGIVSRDLPRALLAGLGVGLLVLVVHVGASPAMDAGEFLALAPASYVAVAAGLLLPVWGSLVRGVL